MRGQKNEDRPATNPSLPPCRVCGAPGSGFHYGVTTCGACKGFFRRSLVRTEPYICVQSHLCNVGPGIRRREICPKCRYDKCAAMGMSKEAIKVGRYSLAKKSRDKQEVLEHKTQVSDDNTESDDDTDVNTEYGRNNTVLTTKSTGEGVNVSPTQCPVLWDSPTMERFSDVPCVGHETDSQGDAEGFSPGEEIRWNIERHHQDTSYYNEGCVNKQSKYRLNVIIDDNSDDSVSMNLQYTLMEPPAYNGTVTPSVDLDTPNTTSPISCFDLSNFIDHLQHPINTVPLAEKAITIPYNQNPIAETISSLHLNKPASPHYVQINNTGPHPNYSNHTEQLTMTTQQQSFPLGQQQLPVNYHTLQQDFTTMQTKFKEQPIHQQANQDIESNNCMETFYIANQDRTSYIANQDRTSSIANQDSSSSIANQDSSSSITNQDSSFGIIDGMNDVSIDEQFFEPAVSANQECGNTIYPITESCDNDLHTSSIKNRMPSDTNSSSSKRQYDGDDGNEIPHKMTGCIQTPVIRSSVQLVPAEMGRPVSLLPAASTSLILCFVSPESSNGRASLYDRFTFRSYERESLAPLLKQCFGANEFLPLDAQIVPESETVSPKRLSICSNVKETPLIYELTSDQSQELQKYISTLNYDSSEMDALFNRLMLVHKRYSGNKSSYMPESDIKGAQDSFWALCELHEKLYGKMKFIEDDKYFTILDSTGIDVDNRKEWILTYLRIVDGDLARVITFFKSVLNNITLADKITLTKSNLITHCVLRAHRGFDLDKGICIDEDLGTASRLGVIGQMVPQVKDIEYNIMTMADNMKSLNMSYEEFILFKALVITTPNPGDVIEQPEVVSEHHIRYQQCLLYHERKCLGPSGDDRFAEILIILQRVNAMRGELVIFKKETANHLVRLIEDSPLWLVKETCFDIKMPQPPIEGPSP